jgi:hypothetical protein
MHKLAKNDLAEKTAGISNVLGHIPGVHNIREGNYYSEVAKKFGREALNDPDGPFFRDMSRQLASDHYFDGGAKLLGTGLALGGAAYGAKKLYNKFKNRQEVNKTAGVSDILGYIPGVRDIRLGNHNTNLVKEIASRPLEDMFIGTPPDMTRRAQWLDEGRLIARDHYLRGGTKLLGTGLAVAGAAYGGKKLYDKFKAKREADKTASAIRGLNKLAAAAAVAAPAPTMMGTLGQGLLYAAGAAAGGLAVQKGIAAAGSLVDKLQKPKNLARMMAVNPALRAVDPGMLSLAYDSLASISPKIVNDPLVGSSVLLKHVNTTDLNALRSAADLYRSGPPSPTASAFGSAVSSAIKDTPKEFAAQMKAYKNP